MRVRPQGGKSYILKYNAGRGRGAAARRVTIGAVGTLTPDDARGKAQKLLQEVISGDDPSARSREKREKLLADKNAPTVADVLDRFLAEHVDVNLKKSTAYDYRRTVNKILKPRLGTIKARDLRPQHVAEMHHSMRETRVMANNAVRILSSAMGFAETWGLREPGTNPCGIRKFGQRRRERLFSDNEVARLLNTVDEMEADGRMPARQALAVRLLFATGCRVGEIAALRWDGVDFDQGLLTWEDSKTGRLVKPLSYEARELLEAAPREPGAPFVCAAGLTAIRIETIAAAFEETMRVAGVEANENASCHLIRHWFATKIYSDPTIPLPDQMRIVGHRSVATAMRYAQTRLDEVKSAADASARKRAAALTAARKKLAGNVVPLKGGGAS